MINQAIELPVVLTLTESHSALFRTLLDPQAPAPSAEELLAYLFQGFGDITSIDKLNLSLVCQEKAEPTKAEASQSVYDKTVQMVRRSLRDGYIIRLFKGQESIGDADKEIFVQSLSEAEPFVKEIASEELGEFGSVRVINSLTKSTMMSAVSARGGFEVSSFDSNENRLSFETWLSKEASRERIKQFVKQKKVATIIVTDLSCRQSGPISRRICV